MDLVDYLHFVSGAQSLEELWHNHVQQMSEYGFDRLMYGYTRYKTETSLGDPDDFLILTNHNQDYVNGFLNNGLYFHAPMLRWALENEGAGSWQKIQQMAEQNMLDSKARRVVEFNQSQGMSAGYTVSFFSASKRYKGAISLGAKKGIDQREVDSAWREQGDDIVLMNNVVHLKILTLPYETPNRTLTKRQKEALQWVGDGKTTQDIALLMGLTAATVEKHLRLARESLSVETTAQAVLKATLQNQMYIVES
ncbi:autoinducer-binding transcriptional regulator, LuxR family protein [Roseobacter sp. SK209-2-6]|uniref:autoinducer binding domain-containing protein n=1 Tax=Roseobacter sp. SK209-2-6 TaxID=388739 RepID=UPI0000F3F769|nr:autoinducer binding domain-containing protein [Roseobacter sp. SK209-2-6]EBA17835.1 autoinducer-binding transcriptional regulator, LuxR family protein [Roseobacter sp. SK209-2-6]